MLTSLKRSPLNRLRLVLAGCLGWMALIFGMSHRQTIPVPPGLGAQFTSIAGHFTVYLVLSILLYWTLSFLMADTRWRYVVAWVLAVLYGVSDEWHQSFVPGRTPDVMDVATDALGVTVGLLIVWWARRHFLARLQPEDAERR